MTYADHDALDRVSEQDRCCLEIVFETKIGNRFDRAKIVVSKRFEFFLLSKRRDVHVRIEVIACRKYSVFLEFN